MTLLWGSVANLSANWGQAAEECWRRRWARLFSPSVLFHNFWYLDFCFWHHVSTIVYIEATMPELSLRLVNITGSICTGSNVPSTMPVWWDYDIVCCFLFEEGGTQINVFIVVRKLCFNSPKAPLWTEMTQSLEAKQNRYQKRVLKISDIPSAEIEPQKHMHIQTHILYVFEVWVLLRLLHLSPKNVNGLDLFMEFACSPSVFLGPLWSGFLPQTRNTHVGCQLSFKVSVYPVMDWPWCLGSLQQIPHNTIKAFNFTAFDGWRFKWHHRSWIDYVSDSK